MTEKKWSLSLNHWLLKLTAFLLAMACGAAMVLGGAGWLLGEPMNLYDRVREDRRYSTLYSFCHQAGTAVFDRFAWEQSGVDKALYERFFHWGGDVDAVEELEYDFYYDIQSSANGKLLATNRPEDAQAVYMDTNEWSVRSGGVTVMPLCDYYPSYGEYRTDIEGYRTQSGAPLPELPKGIIDYEYYVVSDSDKVNPGNISRSSYSHTSAGGAEYTIYRIEYGAYENYDVTISMTQQQQDAVLAGSVDSAAVVPGLLEQYQSQFHTWLLWGGIGLVFALLWLALTAGKNARDDKLEAGGLNVIPLDLYLTGEVCGQTLLVFLTASLAEELCRSDLWGSFTNGDEWLLWAEIGLLGALGAGMALLLAMFLTACAAQMKMGGTHWVKNTLIAHTWHFGWKAVVWVWKGCWAVVRTIFRWVAGFFRWLGELCGSFGRLLPLAWQWLVVSGLLWSLMFLCILIGLETYSIGSILFGVLVTVLLVLYGGYCFGRLRDTAKKMAQGDLNAKLGDRFLTGCFQDFAGDLNALGDVCIASARTQMKSERMRSELITNVSHDIKTPLTSIINYVDLLQKTDDEARRKDYLEVLDRQSQRLKKLIEDLMEMSKASSGNVSVELTPTDVGEAVNQALGEFADTFSACGLQVLLKAPQEPVMALCDGKHLWRVLSNVLGNAVKYAMPGTRVYVDVTRSAEGIEVSLKNISRMMLNITAEELMERFVRGDASRNTEGNGLGLNIARSLMEVQGGKLDLVVDGDLFKVVLTLPAA